jgi:ribose/xylose/arabinose/galactoside ABC-type transport system permease subunit
LYTFLRSPCPVYFILDLITLITSGGRSRGHAGLDRLYTGSWVRIPLKAWMFVLVFLCCVVLCR